MKRLRHLLGCKRLDLRVVPFVLTHRLPLSPQRLHNLEPADVKVCVATSSELVINLHSTDKKHDA